ncbi:MAG: nitroreductase [Gammaproteobacteria bacterium]|nr:nitroreductase [Gammaproteobacteria bacterium]
MSQTLKSLQQRISIPAELLIEPAPSSSELEQIIQAAICAPDHGGIRPWRFLTIAGDARKALGRMFCTAALANNPDLTAVEQKAIQAKTLRSPLIIAVIAAVKPHPKVPAKEQVHSAAAATQNILLAADALGYGSIWLTGPFAADPLVCSGLGLSPAERIVAFVYMGTPSAEAATARKKIQNRPRAADFVSEWNP